MQSNVHKGIDKSFIKLQKSRWYKICLHFDTKGFRFNQVIYHRNRIGTKPMMIEIHHKCNAMELLNEALNDISLSRNAPIHISLTIK